MEKNMMVMIKPGHPHHANRIGYFQFAGTGVSKDTHVFSTEKNGHTLFAVGSDDFEPYNPLTHKLDT